MVKSGRAAALVFVLSVLLGACASSNTIPVMDGGLGLPRVTRTGVPPGDQGTSALHTAAGTELDEVSGERTVDPNGALFMLASLIVLISR